MQSFVFAALISAAAAVSSDELEFVNYTARFNKAYDDVVEFTTRFERFKHNNRFINEHNATNSNVVLGTNQFSDWTDADWKAYLTFSP